jgi:peptide/nickel transport system permease protein
MGSIFGIVVKRLGLGVLTIIVISVLIFLGIEALPGDVATAILGQEATPETVAAFRKELKLDLPPHVRYFAWLGDFLRGDMGTSLANKRPISELIFWRFQNTIFLAASAAVVAVPIAVILGILAALYRNSLFDRTISMVTLSTISRSALGANRYFPKYFQYQRPDVVLAEDTFDYFTLPDADAGCGGPYDASDEGCDHQHPGQPVY